MTTDYSQQAFEVPGQKVSFIAVTDCSDYGYHFVKQSGEVGMIPISSDSDIPLGVLQDEPTINRAGCVMLSGISMVIAGSATAIGPLKIDGTGQVLTGTHGVDHIVGKGLNAAVSEGDIIAVLINPGL